MCSTNIHSRRFVTKNTEHFGLFLEKNQPSIFTFVISVHTMLVAQLYHVMMSFPYYWMDSHWKKTTDATPVRDENEDEDQWHLMTNFMQGKIAAHELYKVRDMNEHKSQFSITTQVNQCSIRQTSTTIYKYTNT